MWQEMSIRSHKDSALSIDAGRSHGLSSWLEERETLVVLTMQTGTFSQEEEAAVLGLPESKEQCERHGSGEARAVFQLSLLCVTLRYLSMGKTESRTR